MKKITGVVFVALLSLTSIGFSDEGVTATYSGRLAVDSSINDVHDHCDAEVSINATQSKVTVTRTANKCDAHVPDEKTSVFEFDLQGDKLQYQGKEVGTFKKNNLSVKANFGIFIYEISVLNLSAHKIQYSEKVYLIDGTGYSLSADIEGGLILK